ncbi:ABC.CD.A, putative ABC transport system ATP-binding protein [Nostoc flagelliforme CCNUN1]|uniref:ABC.CD.A, putative ABC transport system ATP-binding protein n=1 Tax=Nostoc flagelliforme CCNUN1 TaxID=2038116 RepID=A0A2K8SJ92_9NOSO|nr:ATP-binding cassette domain-containing protein [Nostoc flagelliforme]AUB35410.1 ABC.CD.A, putative ABC transport system ATP-binding protein [Nostoc flagelliforme CCNUN1]
MQTLNFSKYNQSLTPEPVISARNLNHYFGDGALRKQALFDINLEINPGDIVIMTGPSGSGKTTRLTLMGGLRSAQEGSLKILGQEISNASKQQLTQLRRQIGYIFQPTAALDKKSGRDVVELMQKLAKEQGCTILLVTHDNRILDIADRIIYMEDGQLITVSNV